MWHIDLFSGIGGFALAAEMVWDNVRHTFVEYDPFCQEVLKKHWPEADLHGDIRKFVADAKKGRREGRQVSIRKRRSLEASGDSERPYIITGGFPCQPFSAAGLRKGTADDRYLWPVMLECITLYRPRWVIAENVAGLATWNEGLVLETVCTDLEKEGYEVQPFVIPATAVGAPHRRDRVWIVAHAEFDGWGQGAGTHSIHMQNGRAVRISKTTGTRFGARLADAIGMLPTARRSDYKGSGMKHSSRNRNPMTNSLMDAIEAGPEKPTGKGTGLKLQPRFVEWMMGYPEDWTALPDSKLLAMRSSHRSRQK